MIATSVTDAFDGAPDYDGHARVQQIAATWLADAIVETAPRHARILEIGCGTGFLAEATLDRLAGGDWLMTDIAPGMVARARARFDGRAGVRFAMLDGEMPDLPSEPPFDLVVSGFAAQWFADAPAAFARQFALLRAGGTLLVTTLAAGTFAEWRAAHDAEGLVAGTPAFLSRTALEAIRLDGVVGRIAYRTFEDRHDSTRAFLRGLHAIGAGTPRAGHRPLGPGALRRVARRFEHAGAITSYEVALCRFTKPAA
jgi:malonyl-CoA O-methyltransferase